MRTIKKHYKTLRGFFDAANGWHPELHFSKNFGAA